MKLDDTFWKFPQQHTPQSNKWCQNKVEAIENNENSALAYRGAQYSAEPVSTHVYILCGLQMTSRTVHQKLPWSNSCIQVHAMHLIQGCKAHFE